MAPKTLIDLLEYSKKTQVLDTVYDEQTKLDIVGTFVKNRSLVQDPRYISYFLKKNLPYRTKDYNQIITTSDTKVASLPIDKKSITINGYTEYTSELDVDAYTHTLHK